MSSWLIVLTGIIYAWVSLEQFVNKNPAMGIVYAGYSFSNVGLWLVVK